MSRSLILPDINIVTLVFLILIFAWHFPHHLTFQLSVASFFKYHMIALCFAFFIQYDNFSLLIIILSSFRFNIIIHVVEFRATFFYYFAICPFLPSFELIKYFLAFNFNSSTRFSAMPLQYLFLMVALGIPICVLKSLQSTQS